MLHDRDAFTQALAVDSELLTGAWIRFSHLCPMRLIAV